MNVEQLVVMANDIAAFFDAESGPAASEGVRTHIARYWEARMKREIVEHLRKGGTGLVPTARAAIEKLAGA
jgi:formate dehydrogenase subunit delta